MRGQGCRAGNAKVARLALAAAWVLAAAGCTGTYAEFARDQVAQYGDPRPTPQAFHYCFGHGCAERARLALPRGQWAEVVQPLQQTAEDAAAERHAIAEAAARFRRATGRLAATQGDLPGTFDGVLRTRQLDCVDETVNMTQFLRMLDQLSLLRFHKVGDPAVRGRFIDAWPHMSATVVEKTGGRRFVVDAWDTLRQRRPVVIEAAAWRERVD